MFVLFYLIEGIFPWKKMMSCFNVMQLPTLHGISPDNDNLFSDIYNAPTVAKFEGVRFETDQNFFQKFGIQVDQAGYVLKNL